MKKQKGFHEVVKFTDVNTRQQKKANGCYLYIRLNISTLCVEIAEMVEDDNDSGFYRIVDKQLIDCGLTDDGRSFFFIVYDNKMIDVVNDIQQQETSLEII